MYDFHWADKASTIRDGRERGDTQSKGDARIIFRLLIYYTNKFWGVLLNVLESVEDTFVVTIICINEHYCMRYDYLIIQAYNCDVKSK